MGSAPTSNDDKLLIGGGRPMRALVYSGPREDTARRLGSPTALWVTEADVLNGVANMQCPACGGTGHFPMPEPDMEDFCVMCKGQGLVLVMA